MKTPEEALPSDFPVLPQVPVAQAISGTRFVTVRTIVALMLREMTTTYGRSPGGYIWAIAQPVAMIVVFSLGFSLMLRSPSLGTSFLLFYASGILPLRLFQHIVANVGASLQFNRALLTYPRVTFADSLIARAFLAFLTQIIVASIVLFGIYFHEGIREIIDLKAMIVAMLLATLLAMGIGTFNSFMSVIYPLYAAFWQTATRPLILISGVFYTYEDLPVPAQNLLWWNPIIHITAYMRKGLYSTYEPQFVSMVYVLVVALVPMVFGLLLLRRYHNEIIHI
jgi:capsular polysaccharide transport system permease protein